MEPVDPLEYKKPKYNSAIFVFFCLFPPIIGIIVIILGSRGPQESKRPISHEKTGRQEIGHLTNAIEKNQKDSSSYYTDCNQGKGRKCFKLASLLNQEGNATAALTLYQKACEGKIMMGCSNAGTLEMQRGNAIAAQKFFTMACEGGGPYGCSELGTLEYRQGNHAKAHALFELACQKGNRRGCFNLATLEHKKGNKARAQTLFKKSCDQGDELGCRYLRTPSSL